MSHFSELQPFDEHNQRLKANVHPDGWTNPIPSGRYNLVVIGAGTAGLVTASIAAGLGAKVALIERNLMGGDCLNAGCVPSKGVISAARAAAQARTTSQFGVHVSGDVQVDFAAVMERMRRLRADISPADSVARFTDKGIDVFLGNASFVRNGAIDVAGQTLEYKKAVIATGARAARLPIPGLEEIEPRTNESIFSLTTRPARLVVIGGGPIGTEMAQAFARLGSQVTQIEKESHILSREDADAAEVVQESMQAEGVEFVLNAEVLRCERHGDDKVVIVRQRESERAFTGDEVLIGIGRQPNVENLGLEKVGVEYDERSGIRVNERLQTTNQHIYAAGDVCSEWKFTHAADFMARTVVRNALFLGRGSVSRLVIPRVTYTSPELAHVGLTLKQANEKGLQTDTYLQRFEDVDRAILEGETSGFARVIVQQGTDNILGATIVAPHAGEMINILTLAMTQGLGLGKIGSTIHPYPTQAEAIRKLADQYSRTRLTPLVSRLMGLWLKWTR